MKKLLVLTMCLVLPVGLWAARDPLKKVAKKMGKSIDKKSNFRIGVLAFPYHNGYVSSGSSIVSERLTTHMVNQKRGRVIERRLVTKLLEEQRLSETGVLDPQTVQEIGKVLGVDIIITGTLIDFDKNKTEVNARSLNAETGEVIAASRVKINRTWRDRPKPLVKKEPSRSEVDQYEEKEEDDDLIRIGYPSGRRGHRGRFR